MAYSQSDRPAKSAKVDEIDIAIVGGGIAGLYCALKYQRNKFKSVRLFEALSEPGGRISTGYFPENGPREFDAEFGPMRIEPDQQPLLKDLLDRLDIREKAATQTGEEESTSNDNAKRTNKTKSANNSNDTKKSNDSKKSKGNDKSHSAYLVDFPSYASPVDQREPRYELSGEEREQKTPLDLLKLAFVRIVGRLVSGKDVDSTNLADRQPRIREDDDGSPKSSTGLSKEEMERLCLKACLNRGRDALVQAMASRQPEWKGSFQWWIDQLEDEDYQNIREYAELRYHNSDQVPLWQMGFWNLMSDVLSHDAVAKLRDQGSFYHLIPENPNAAEWLVFWLRGLKTSESLKGIEGGMSSITDRIKAKLKDIKIETHHKLTHMRSHEDKHRVRLTFRNMRDKGQIEVIAKHVILAIPKMPLQTIVSQSGQAFPEQMRLDISRCWGFPMTKVFAIVKRRWWEEDQRANFYAGRVPTRELHYWKSRVPGSRRGMIMAYADRPGTNFWANYLCVPGQQEKPEWGPVEASFFKRETNRPAGDHDNSAPDLGEVQTRRLVYKLVQYLQDTGAESLRETDIEYYGIRDWGREPYGAANHTWLPETRSWLVLRHLSGFALEGTDSGMRNVHICGEAYSDYHGFIEGSLRSAAHILHQIDDTHELELQCHDGKEQTTITLRTPTPWLCSISHCNCATDTARQSSPDQRAKVRAASIAKSAEANRQG